MNRFRTISLLAALCATALIATGCGGDKSSNTAGVSPEQAKQNLIAALKNTGSLKTGTIELVGKIGMTGGATTANAGNMTFKGSGPFDISDPANQKVDLKIEFSVAGQTQTIGVIAVDGKTYIEFAGQAMELDKQGGSSVSELTDTLGPGMIAKLAKGFETNIENVRKTTTKQVGGSELVIYTAEIDFTKALSALTKDGKGGLLGGLTGAETKQAKDAFKVRTVEFGVDESGNVVRSINIAATIKDPKGKDAATGVFEISIAMLKADGPVEITAPENAIKGGGAAMDGLLGGMSGGN